MLATASTPYAPITFTSSAYSSRSQYAPRHRDVMRLLNWAVSPFFTPSTISVLAVNVFREPRPRVPLLAGRPPLFCLVVVSGCSAELVSAGAFPAGCGSSPLNALLCDVYTEAGMSGRRWRLTLKLLTHLGDSEGKTNLQITLASLYVADSHV